MFAGVGFGGSVGILLPVAGSSVRVTEVETCNAWGKPWQKPVGKRG
jgi:hypothetical protein